MKNFLQLQATDLFIDISMVVEPQAAGTIEIWLNKLCIYSKSLLQPVQMRTSVPVLTPIEIEVKHQGAYVSSLKFDGWETRPQWGEEHPGVWKFSTDGKVLYTWKHHVTGQGWLLQP